MPAIVAIVFFPPNHVCNYHMIKIVIILLKKKKHLLAELGNELNEKESGKFAIV